jgi:D-proline reductase (dithiol) PrdB
MTVPITPPTLPLEPLDTTGLRQKYEEWIEFIARAHHGANPRVNEEPAFTPLSKPLSECRVALLTTAGAHLADQPPFHVATTAGDHSLRVLPDDLDPSRLRFTHTHYDTSSAEADPNCVFPVDRLHELVAEGRVGSASPVHVGMMGFNPDPTPVADVLAPQVVGLLHDAQVDAALLVPG